jgi:F-type H+-transporting ATPase subunit epsilon
MKHTIHCDIVSAQEQIFSGEATMVFATGRMGELGISPRHAPLLTVLKPGPVRVQKPDGEEAFFFVGGGILEVMPHVVTVLADTAVRADDLDQAAAERARDEAERALQDRTGGVEVAEAEARLAEAAAQLRALEQLRKQTKRRG